MEGIRRTIDNVNNSLIHRRRFWLDVHGIRLITAAGTLIVNVPTITLANAILRCNSLYSKGPYVIVSRHNGVEVNARLFSTTCRTLFCTICHSLEITFRVRNATLNFPHYHLRQASTRLALFTAKCFHQVDHGLIARGQVYRGNTRVKFDLNTVMV